MKEVRWQLEGLGTEDAFQDLVQESLSFPHYYGRNLDAFWDCLNEIIEEITIRVSGRETLGEELRKKIDPYLGMCREYETATRGTFHLVIE
jgi:RNAse (barnase) inhibitor barstar